MNATVETETTIARRRREAAERLGVQESQVQTHRIELNQLREAGLLVDLDIHGVSMFSIPTTFAELGIGVADVRAKRLRTGRKDLFPVYSKKFRSLEARARQNLTKYSHTIPAFGQYRWLPWTAYQAFKEQHDRVLAELVATKAELISKYTELYDENALYFANVARRAWQDLRAGFADPSHAMIVTTDHAEFGPDDEDRFVDYVVQISLLKIPNVHEIEHAVRIDYKTSILYSESEIAVDDAALAQARAQLAQAQLEQAEAAQSAFEIKLGKNEAESQSQARIAAYRQAELAHAREQLAEMGSPIQDALDGLRANLYDAVQTLLAGLRKNNGFRGKASKKAAELYEYWKTLNGGLLQDSALDQSLAGLNEVMQSYQSATPIVRQIRTGEIEAQLDEIAILTAASARNIRSGSNSRASALEL